MKPKENYPPAQIALINELLGELAAQDQQYNDLIAAADLAFGNKNYAPSFDDYKAASLLKPEESYPKEKMAEIEQIMKELADLEMAYNEAIKSGDEQFELKSWSESLGFYQTAKGLKPEEAYPQQKIDEINALLQNLADQDAAYEQAIAQGDQNFESEIWEESKTAYQTALGIKPQEEYPASQIALIDQKLEELVQLQAQFDALIKEGDALFAAKNYIESKSKFQQAGTLQPQEAYPPQKIAEIDLLLKDLADQDAAYDQAIAQGDQYFESENWNESKASYQTALGIKPQEEYPVAQIALIDEKLGAIAAQDQQYNDLIAAADLAFESKNYSPSIEDYKAASLVKPEESYPKERIAEIEQIMKELADLELAYNEAIKSGDEQFELKSWTESLGFYQTAKSLKPEETYPQQKIDEINALLQNLADQDAAYEQAIAQGDQNFESENWQESKTAYQTALGIKPEEEYPASQIALIDQKLGELAQLKAQYDALIKEGDDLFVAKNYIESKSKFQQAGSLQPQEAYPPQKIAEIDLLLQELADLDASYNNAIAQADLLFGEKNWSESITQYQVALGLKPAEQYPKDQIADIEAFLETMRERNAQYTQLIEEADGHRDQENYESALTKYQAALNIKKEEVYPQEQIDLINARLKEMADQEALYLSLIATGDEQFAAQTYAPALSSFQQASSLKPEEQYPKDKIAEIQSILDQFAETDRLYAEAIANADQNRDQEVWQAALAKYQEASGIKPEETYPKQQIDFVNQKIKELAELQAAYEAAIAKADQEFEAKDWQNALSSYQSALSLKPEETHPQSRITEINGILKEMADLDAAYQLAISEADGFYKGNDWNASLEKYQQASNLKPAEQYPKDKIAELNNILGEIAAQQAKYDAFIQQADQLFATENWESSKEKYQSALGVFPEEVYPKNQIVVIDEKLAAIAALQQQYETLIEEADRQFAKEIWQEALVQYQQAATLIPEEVYPKDQIAIVNQKIQELADQQVQYEALVAQADQLYESVKYTGAIAKYEEALLIYPKEEYPASQIRMINKLLAEIEKKREEYSKLVAEGDGFFENKDYLKAQSVYSQAREIFADSIYPQNQLGLIADLLQIQENYKELIKKGDEQFANKEYEASLQSFKEAQSINSEEAYPEQKIEEIEKILSLIAMTKAAYDQFILDADAHFTAEEYEEAKSDYQLAIEQLPNEDYPRQKIMEIDRILADIARKKAQFDNIIAQANQSFDKKEYETSLAEYQEALSILPEEAYPQQRITEINELLALIADKQKHFDVLVQQGDQAFENAEYQKSIDLFTEANEVLPNELYPPKRIAEARSEMERIQMEIDMAYSKAIAAGDRGFNQEEWEDAKLQYQSAIDIKPEELYPKEKLAEINKIQEELLLAQQRAYDEHIANGERFYSTKYYDESMIAFESALEIYPDQDYPKEMIEKLKILIEKSAIITLIDQETRMFQDSKYDYKYKPVNYKNKNDSYILIEVKPLTNNETKVYLSFGNSGTTNGEYYIYLDNNQEYKKYYVVLGDNIKWLSNSNNFLKVKPEGGNVDVKLLQISRN
jgi:tetratricopeptide (TPR) repeat protein